LLKSFGATPVDERVVLDGTLVSTAGVTAGIDGALRVTALLFGEQKALEIQLNIQYAPDPPFKQRDESCVTDGDVADLREQTTKANERGE
jgi:cyclohexyl-isocyanide hydratase